MLFRCVIHPDGIRPVAIKSFTGPLPGGIDAHLGTEAHHRSSMVEHIDGPLHEDDVALGIDVVAHDPGDLGKILHIDVMIHNQQNFAKHHLAQAPQSVHYLPRVPRILFFD